MIVLGRQGSEPNFTALSQLTIELKKVNKSVRSLWQCEYQQNPKI